MTDDGKDYKYTYDVFGRLVAVKNQSSALVAEYRYNGLGYRTGWHYDADADNDVDGSDPWYYFAYDQRWRPVATFRGSDTNLKERFTFHNAGSNGYGGSSYVELVVLRDRDNSVAWTATSDYMGQDLEERTFYCQNWRADVSVVTDDAGTPIEWIKYSAYGVPTSYSLADFDRDGDIDSADDTAFFAALAGAGPGNPDVNYDGDNGTDADIEAFENAHTAASTGGTGVLSRSKTGSRTGYAGYQWDPSAGLYHVRHRAYRSDLGKWTRRDPAGSVDGASLYQYANSRAVVSRDPSGLVATKPGGGGGKPGDDKPFDPPNEYPEPLVPFDPDDIPKPGDLTKYPSIFDKSCGAYLDRYVTVDFQMWWSMATSDCKAKCGKSPTIKCSGDCKGGGEHGSTGGGCPPTVTICTQPNRTPVSDDPARTLIHETIHVTQRCHSDGIQDTCTGSLCRELQAYQESGQCSSKETCCTQACGSTLTVTDPESPGCTFGLCPPGFDHPPNAQKCYGGDKKLCWESCMYGSGSRCSGGRY